MDEEDIPQQERNRIETPTQKRSDPDEIRARKIKEDEIGRER